MKVGDINENAFLCVFIPRQVIMHHPTSPSLLPTIPYFGPLPDQGNPASAAAGSSCSAQRKEGGIPLLHANTRHTATQIEAKFRGRQRDEEPHAPTNLERLPVELLANVVKGLPEHGPCLTSIARVTRLLHINTVSLANKKVAGAVELERSLLPELKKNAEQIADVLGDNGEFIDTRPGEARLDFVKDNLKRAREGLTQADYLQVLYTHVRHLDKLGEWLVVLNPYTIGAFDLLKGGIDIFIGELQAIEPKKNVQERSFPEAAIKAKLAIAEMLLLHIGSVWVGGQYGVATTISQREALSGCIKHVIKEMSLLAAYQESGHKSNTETGFRTGRTILQNRIVILTKIFQDLLKNLRNSPGQEALSAYLELQNMRWERPFLDMFAAYGPNRDRDIFLSIESYVQRIPLYAVDFEGLQTQIKDFKDPEIKKNCADRIVGVQQRLMDKHIYVEVLRSIVFFLQEVYPDDESRMDCIRAMTRDSGSKDGNARQLSIHERNIVAQMINSLEDSQLKAEADAILNGKTILQRMSGVFPAFFVDIHSAMAAWYASAE